MQKENYVKMIKAVESKKLYDAIPILKSLIKEKIQAKKDLIINSKFSKNKILMENKND